MEINSIYKCARSYLDIWYLFHKNFHFDQSVETYEGRPNPRSEVKAEGDAMGLAYNYLEANLCWLKMLAFMALLKHC